MMLLESRIPRVNRIIGRMNEAGPVVMNTEFEKLSDDEEDPKSKRAYIEAHINPIKA